MRILTSSLIAALSIIFTSPLLAAPSKTGLSIYEYASRIAVKVMNESAEIFTADRAASHGSGFFIGTRQNAAGKLVGIVFTNKHVVDSTFDEVQRIQLELPTNGDRPEVITAKLVYVSKTCDFAVIEFQISDLKRSKGILIPAKLPQKDDLLFDFARNYGKLKGLEVLAQGNPLDSTDIGTPGVISGRWKDPIHGDFVQTTAAINPGNSGGPLIDVETGTIVGMNTLKIEEADTMGFAIPIGRLLEDYQQWLEDPSYANQRTVNVRFGSSTEAEAEVIGAAAIIKAKYPKFFDNVNGLVLKVDDASPASGLRIGDLVLKVDGKMQQGYFYEFRQALQKAKKPLKVELLRNGKVMSVTVPFLDEGMIDRRQKVDFVNISGMIFRRMGEKQIWWIDHNLKSHVLLYEFLDTAEVNFGSSRLPMAFSVLVGINIDFVDYEIRTLTDLKKVLKRHPNAKFMRLDVREPLSYKDSAGRTQIIRDSYGVAKYSPATATFVVPITEVITPREFSVHRFAKRFGWEQGDIETRNWRDFVKRPSCEQVLDPTEAEKNK